MDLQIKNQLFLVGGATSGLGKAIAETLIKEDANVILVARTTEKLNSFKETAPQQIETIAGDLSQSDTIQKIINLIGDRKIAGAAINSGGPPAMSALDTTLEDWDQAYASVFRWKVELTHALVKKMIPENYGRLVYIESVSVKQPVENLVLSNSMRLAVVGFVKTLSQEIAKHGITLNILGPGYHATQRMENLFIKNSELKGIPVAEVRATFEHQVKVGQLGTAEDFASLGAWLLSPVSRYITGQTISVDGGLVQGTFG